MKLSPRKIVTLLLSGAAFVLSGTVQAQSTSGTVSEAWPSAYKGYVGLNGGRNHFENGHGNAYSLYAGGMWSQQWGLELGGTDFGHGTNTKARGLYIAGLGRLPLNDTFAVYARLGLLYSRGQASGASDTGFGETYGVGMDLSLNRQWAAVLQFDRSAVHFPGGVDRMNMGSVGLKYRF